MRRLLLPQILLLVLLTFHSAPADPEKRAISDPEALKPGRFVPLEYSLPSLLPSAEEPLHLDLGKAMTLALREAPSLERVQSKIRQAQYQVEEAYTLANPTATFRGQYSRVEPPVSIPGGIVINPANNYEASLALRQAIFTFGRLKWNVLVSKLSKRAAQEEYRGEVNRLLLLVAQSYIDALVAQERVIIAEDNLEAQLANLRVSRSLLEQGVAANFDVLRISAASSQAQQTLIEARTGEQLARARLLSLLNLPAQKEISLQALSLYAPKQEMDLESFQKCALDTRPDLRSLRWTIEAAKAQVVAVEKSNNPSLELQNTTVMRNATGFAPGTQNTTAIVLNIPLFDGGVTHFQREQARESVLQLTHDLEQAERDVVLQVEEYQRQLFDLWQALDVGKESVAQADEALRVALLRYENGISTNVELLDSQAARSEARFRLSQAQGRYLAARWNWWQATTGEYPVEVNFPPDIRARLQAEGIPRSDEAFSDQEFESKFGPSLRIEETPVMPIKGL